MKISDDILSLLFSNKEKIVGIIGENGTGKTTTAKYMAGLLIKEGKSINKKEDVALILQNPYQQFVGRTIFDEITFILEQENKKHKEIKEILNQYKYDLNKLLINLSGGEAQEILLYNFLLSEKKVIICDENFSNLDSDKKTKLFEKIRKSDKKIILITNNIYDLKFCDVVYELKEEEIKEKKIKLKEPQLLKNNLDDVLFLEDISNFKIKNKQNLVFKYGLNLLVGRSGSGKSSIFEMLCSFEKYNGNIKNPLKGTFILSQYPSEQITTTKVKEEFKETKELISLLNEFNLPKEILNKDIVDLSTGELTQIMLIKAILSKEELILLDESFEVLDFKKQQIILNLIEKIEDKVIICITHNISIFNKRKVNIVEVL